MASVFTYDEASRVSSPWLTPTTTPKPATPHPIEPGQAVPLSGLLADGLTKLEPEKDDGCVEYKLHLLLRPRRNYSNSSTGPISLSSQRHSDQPPKQDSGPVLSSSNQSRQRRLEQLTTQLLWRLQSSSPYHASSTANLVLPKLSESLEISIKPGKLVAGLEESRGALYEIGVSDDGRLVGLTMDEMEESLKNLRAMASSLGCNVSVLRMVLVGQCEWYELSGPSINLAQPSRGGNGKEVEPQELYHQECLYVAEALIMPDLSSSHKSGNSVGPRATPSNPINVDQTEFELKGLRLEDQDSVEQLRITLTGPSGSGKTSLLGTLSHSIMDNGRGKSRLSLLKHRHEIATGVTSSLGQELWAYKGLEVRNYASGNVSSWTDCHASAQRLVFTVDSPGSLKHRRTIVRAQIGWDPHWTFLCIAAANDIESSGLGASTPLENQASIDPAKAHLEFCLKLEKPLAIVITKLDLADKGSLKDILSKTLSSVKAAGRIPRLIIPPDQSKTIHPPDLMSIQQEEDDTIRSLVATMPTLNSIVPIILSSAVKGTGIRSLHALLKNLPMPITPTRQDLIGPALNPEQPSTLFHIEDVFSLPASRQVGGASNNVGVVISGRLQFGELSTSDHVVIGPFPYDSEPQSSPHSYGPSLSPMVTPKLTRHASRASLSQSEFLGASILSIRNLRLPVRTLKAGQVGTIGLVLDTPEEEGVSNIAFEKLPYTPRIRKGQVLAIPSVHMMGVTLQAASGFTALFADSDINSVTPGNLVVVYIASIRASARVSKLSPYAEPITLECEPDDIFGLHDTLEDEEEQIVFGSDGDTLVTFEFMTTSEWVALGSQVLVMPGGGHGLYSGSERGAKGLAGLEGYIGKILEIVE